MPSTDQTDCTDLRVNHELKGTTSVVPQGGQNQPGFSP